MKSVVLIEVGSKNVIFHQGTLDVLDDADFTNLV